jgi:flavodoxin
MTKALVSYFSASGTTERVAKDLAAATGADLFEIEPVRPYTQADLNWNNKHSRTSIEMDDEACRPGIADMVDGMDAYDTVFIGFPVWWYVEPRIIDTFLEAYDFSGKTVVPFATSGGSSLGQAPRRMQELAPGAKVLAGGLLNGRPSETELAAWLERALER